MLDHRLNQNGSTRSSTLMTLNGIAFTYDEQFKNIFSIGSDSSLDRGVTTLPSKCIHCNKFTSSVYTMVASGQCNLNSLTFPDISRASGFKNGFLPKEKKKKEKNQEKCLTHWWLLPSRIARTGHDRWEILGNPRKLGNFWCLGYFPSGWLSLTSWNRFDKYRLKF